jgi:two-component system OmpR family response regulator
MRTSKSSTTNAIAETPRQHIAVVDDDPEVRAEIAEYLERHGFRVSVAEDGAALRKLLTRQTVDLIVLDLVMPGADGISITSDLRQTSSVAIIICTGKGDDYDKVVTLELGADDYVTKPVALRELLARIRSTLRRTRQPTSEGRLLEYQFDGWRLLAATRQVFDPTGREVSLTTSEFDILAAFLNNPQKVLTRTQLTVFLKSRYFHGYDRSIDNLVSRLRRKLKDNPKSPTKLKTIQSIGYVFIAAVTVAEG